MKEGGLGTLTYTTRFKPLALNFNLNRNENGKQVRRVQKEANKTHPTTVGCVQ
jgi:hypothetical protein